MIYNIKCASRLEPGNGRAHFSRSMAAFTLAEVATGVAVIGILLLSFYTLVANGFNLVRMNRENLRASQILLNRMEGLRLYTWTQLVSNHLAPTNFTEFYYPLGETNARGTVYWGTMTLSDPVLDPPATYATNRMRNVTLTLQWSTGGLQHTRSMSTLVAEYGIQNYIYTH